MNRTCGNENCGCLQKLGFLKGTMKSNRIPDLRRGEMYRRGGNLGGDRKDYKSKGEGKYHFTRCKKER